MVSNIINVSNVFATLASSTGSTAILHNWMIFCTKIISYLSIVNKDYITIMLTVRILINRFRFFEISRITGDFINEKFISERLLMHFFIVER
jgi:hypothetical protein